MFMKSRCSEEFVVKSEVEKLNKFKNKYPHRLSRGRYRKLEKTINAKKRQQIGDGDSVNRDQELSLPSQHEKWKRDQQRPNGDYTSDASRLVAEKIDLLVNSSREGSFVPEPRHDILV
ncbi:unnamed protein product [Lathyrus oleraceus]